MRLPDGKIRKTRETCNTPGDAHELTFCCHKGLKLLSRDYTRGLFIEALDRARRRWDFELWAYVIMPEHVHVLLRPRCEEYDIAAILKAIKQPVSQRAVHQLKKVAPQWLVHLRVKWPGGRIEHRFWQQGGGYDRNISKARAAWGSIEYMHRNPVRRGLVACETDWVWSSARWYAGMDDIRLAMNDCPPPVERH
jgi:putative transposase